MGLPFKPGDWVSDASARVARVKRVYDGEPGEVLFDLVMFGRDGEKIGRVSPALGGPRTFEPACSVEGWQRIKAPTFPLQLKWIEGVARYWTGEPLPPANWTPPKRKFVFRALTDDKFRKALEQIASGHNDARQLAKDTLGK